MGKSISAAQCNLLRSTLPGRDVVVMLDPDAEEDAKIVAERIRETLMADLFSRVQPGRVAVAHLPDGRDPGDCTPDEIARSVRRAMVATGR